jgi:hypothetical protein
MRRLLLFGTGAAVGYVLGAKAGRERYDEIMTLLGSAPAHLPHSVSDATRSGSQVAGDLTEAARAKAHAAIDSVDQKVDDVADHAQQVRAQSEERLEPGVRPT